MNASFLSDFKYLYEYNRESGELTVKIYALAFAIDAEYAILRRGLRISPEFVMTLFFLEKNFFV